MGRLAHHFFTLRQVSKKRWPKDKNHTRTSQKFKDVLLVSIIANCDYKSS